MNCVLAYYGFDPLKVSGLVSVGKWAPIIGGLGTISKAYAKKKFGVRYWRMPNQSDDTSLIRVISVKSGGQLNTLANFAKDWGGPIAIASAIIDETAIAMCVGNYVPNFLYKMNDYDPFSDQFKHPIILPLPFRLPWEH
jgi:hypothetical protein